jgi:hypothetical protein
LNFLVWRKGLRGPTASLDLNDPRQSLDWKTIELATIAIIPLAPDERDWTLDQAIVGYPCPEIVEAS